VELRRFIGILLRWWWVIILSMIFAGLAAGVASKMQQPVYRASTTLLISEAPIGKANDYAMLMTSERLARTYVEMLKTRPILELVIARLGSHISVSALSNMIRIEVVRDTQLIRLIVDDINPARATVVANLLPEVFIDFNKVMQAGRFEESKQSLTREISVLDEQVAQIQLQIAALEKADNPDASVKRVALESDLTRLRQSRAGLIQSYENQRLIEAQTQNNVIVLESASVPTFPVGPRVLLNVLLAVAAGMVLSVLAVFFMEYLDDSIKSADQITAILNLPVIGVTLLLSDKEMENSPIAHKKPRSPITEAFRSLRSNIHFASVDRPIKRLLVTSVRAREGKSFIAANLATVFAQAGNSVALLDCDLHRPTQHKIFDQSNRLGLSEIILQDTFQLENALLPMDIPNLSLLTSGPLPPNPAELLGSKKMGQLLECIAEKKDIIVLDSPPVSALTDATVLANKADGVVLVVEVGSTRLAELMHAKEQLDRTGANILGVVLNKAPVGRRGYYSYVYSYQYSSYYERDYKSKRRFFKHPVSFIKLLVKKKLQGFRPSQLK